MNKQKFEDKVRLIISEQCGADLCDIKIDSYLDDHLGADSLDTIELVLALEEEFNIEITDEEAEKRGYRVDNICLLLAKKLDYPFYKLHVPQKASQDAPEEFYMTDTSKHTPPQQDTTKSRAEASEQHVHIIDDMDDVFTKIKSFAEENNLLLSFDPSGKVILLHNDDEFVVENYYQVKQVIDALKVLDSFRG